MIPDPALPKKNAYKTEEQHPLQDVLSVCTNTSTHINSRMIHSEYTFTLLFTLTSAFRSSGMCLLVHATSNNEASQHCTPLFGSSSRLLSPPGTAMT